MTGTDHSTYTRLMVFALTAALIAPCVSRAQTIGPFVDGLLQLPAGERQPRVDTFLAGHPSTPLFEQESLAVFLYAGTAGSVSVAGDANGWTPGIDTLTNVPGTTFWYGAFAYEPDARLDYKLVIDGTSWIIDPRNPRTSPGGFGTNSELRMPEYPDHPELIERSDVPRGSLQDTMMAGWAPGRERRIRLYLPAGFEAIDDSLGLIVVHDGLEFIDIARMPAVLDNLIADAIIPPMAALFVPPVERSGEYAGKDMDAFASYIVQDVLPGYRSRHRISSDPARSIVMGASNGGNISLYMAMVYPAVFGNVVAFSSNVVPAVMDGFDIPDRLPVRVYLDLGTYDIRQLLPRVRSFRAVLLKRGYDHRYAEFHEGHSWSNWRSHIDDALGFLLSSARKR